MCVRPACYIPSADASIAAQDVNAQDVARRLIARRWLGTLAEVVALGLFIGSILLVTP